MVVSQVTTIISNQENKISYDFKGKLSYSWPKNSSQFELNFGDANYDPLLKYKYGLSYKDNIFIDLVNVKDSNLPRLKLLCL